MQDWKIVNSSKYSLSCCTYVFHRCRFVLAFSVLAFSSLAYSYLRIPYFHIPSSGTFVFRNCVFSRPPMICYRTRRVSSCNKVILHSRLPLQSRRPPARWTRSACARRRHRRNHSMAPMGRVPSNFRGGRSRGPSVFGPLRLL